MPVKPTSRESAVEKELRIRVEALGGVCNKVRLASGRGYFDRIVVLPGGRVIFVELKRPKGGRLSEHQIQLAAVYRALGAAVAIVLNSADIGRLVTRR